MVRHNAKFASIVGFGSQLLSFIVHCTQVGYMDEVVGNITNEIKARGMWAYTLLVRRETVSNVPFHCIQAACRFSEADAPIVLNYRSWSCRHEILPGGTDACELPGEKVWSSDNGGAVHLGGGANNYPLRGGYYNK